MQVQREFPELKGCILKWVCFGYGDISLFFSYIFSSNAHGQLQVCMRPPCLIYLSTSKAPSPEYAVLWSVIVGAAVARSPLSLRFTFCRPGRGRRQSPNCRRTASETLTQDERVMSSWINSQIIILIQIQSHTWYEVYPEIVPLRDGACLDNQRVIIMLRASVCILAHT